MIKLLTILLFSSLLAGAQIPVTATFQIDASNIPKAVDTMPLHKQIDSLKAQISKIKSFSFDTASIKYDIQQLKTNGYNFYLEFKAALEGLATKEIATDIQVNSFTIITDQSGKWVNVNSKLPVNIVIPISSAFKPGTSIIFNQMGEGTPTFLPQPGVTLLSNKNLRSIAGQSLQAVLHNEGLNIWTLTGSIK